MEKCSPAEMRKNLEMVEMLKKAGIDFVAIPVKNEEEKQKFLGILMQNLDEIQKIVDKEEENEKSKRDKSK